jgi:hypothetical protein
VVRPPTVFRKHGEQARPSHFTSNPSLPQHHDATTYLRHPNSLDFTSLSPASTTPSAIRVMDWETINPKITVNICPTIASREKPRKPRKPRVETHTHR